MSDTVIRVEDVSKQYRLGEVGTGTLSHDLNRAWARMRGKPDPFLKVTESNDRAHRGASQYVWALQDINFEVKQGEVLGIIGRNGAGKSTLLKILSRVTAPTTGQIKLKGRVASLLEVGTGFHPELTGRENVYLNGAIMGMSRAETAKKMDEIVDFSGCERYIDTPVKRYSSGMRVRLGFAVAAHLDPEILIVDEVLAVGDAEFQKKCVGKMQDVSGEGRTVLFVSHNMGSVRSLCETGMLLVDGAVNYIGTAVQALDLYSQGALENSSCSEEVEDQARLGFTLRTLPKDKTYFDMGEEVSLSFEVTAPTDVESPSIGLVAYNSEDVPIFGSRSDIFGVTGKGAGCTWIMDIRFPDIPLLPGFYSVSIWFASKSGVTLAVFRKALNFQIRPTGRLHKDDFLPKSWGSFYWKPRWEIVTNATK